MPKATKTTLTAAREALQRVLALGIREIRTQDALCEKVYQHAFLGVLAATRDPETVTTHLATLRETVELYVQCDLYQLCMDKPLVSIEAWTRCLRRALSIQEGYSILLHPYNEAMRRFLVVDGDTTKMVHSMVAKLVQSHVTTFQRCLDDTLQHYTHACVSYAYARTTVAESNRMEVERAPGRKALAQWLSAARPFEKVMPPHVAVPSSLAPVLHASFPGFETLGQEDALMALSRCYEMELSHYHLLHPWRNAGHARTYMRRICMRRMLRHFHMEGEWSTFLTRMKSRTPRTGKPSLYYDEHVLNAFVAFDASIVETAGIRFKSLPFQGQMYFNASTYMRMFYLYAAASLWVRERMVASWVRKTWSFVHTVLSGTGPGGCFASEAEDTGNPLDNLHRLERLHLSGVVLKKLQLHAETVAMGGSDARHPLLPWLVDMMDPLATGLSWSTDNRWWRDLFAAAQDRETLVWQYLEHSLKPRLVTREVDVDNEMDLMVCMSMCFEGVPSRALQQYRHLLAPCSIRPDFTDERVETVYLAPQIAWMDIPATASLVPAHPTLHQPMAALAADYPLQFFSERRVTWCPWYSVASLTLESPSHVPRTLTAPVNAAHLVAHMAEMPDGCTRSHLCAQGPSNSHLMVAFWLNHLVWHKVVAESDHPDDAVEPTYTLCEWEGTHTVPIPDIPPWAYDDASKDGSSGDGVVHYEAQTLLTAKELIESQCMVCMKHTSQSVTQKALVQYLTSTVSRQVTVDAQSITEAVDGLIRKGYLEQDEHDHLVFAQDEEEDV